MTIMIFISRKYRSFNILKLCKYCFDIAPVVKREKEAEGERGGEPEA